MWDIDNGNSECLSDLPKDTYLYESRVKYEKRHFYVEEFLWKEKGMEYLKSEYSWEIQDN